MKTATRQVGPEEKERCMFRRKKAPKRETEPIAEPQVKAGGPVIEASTDGPYIVTGVTDLRDRRGEPLPTESVMYLCRCGGSRSKPFCDATHVTNGFSGEPLAGDNGDSRDYEGRDLVIHDNRTVCAHVGYCFREAPNVFDRGRQPWIKPDEGDPVEVVKAAIRHCPSGALSYTEEDERHDSWEREPALKVTRNGPYRVMGGPGLHGQVKVRPVVAEHYALCRCGESLRKPYYDGTHIKTGFSDE